MRRRLPEILLVAFIVATGYGAGARALADYKAAGHEPFFYQATFAHAVAFGCGFGLRNMDLSTMPEVAAFLNSRVRHVDCSSIPPDTRFVPMDTLQGISRYLALAIGSVWRVRGVSWDGLAPLFALLFACSAALSYGILRLGARPLIAAAGTLLVVFSPVQIINLPGLRDYAKAPFVLALLLLAGMILLQRRRERHVIALCVLAGLVNGIGLGFRNDLLLFIPLLAAVILLAPVPDGPPVTRRLVRLASFAGGFVAVAAPVLAAYGQGSNTAHVILLGMMTPFDMPLGIQRPIYDIGHLYNDSYVYVAVRSFADRVFGTAVTLGSAAYDEASTRYLVTIVGQFPADVLARGAGSVAGVFHETLGADDRNVGFLTGWMEHLVRWRAQVSPWLWGPALVSGAGVLLHALGERPRETLVALAVVLALFAAAALQFQERHFFYLELVALWPLVAAVDRIVSAVVAGPRTLLPERWDWRIAVGLPVVMGAVVLAAFAGSRVMQQRGLSAEIRRLAAAPSDPVAMDPIPAAEGRVLFPLPFQDVPDPARIDTEYYAIDLGGPDCEATSLVPMLRYASARAFDDFTREIEIHLPLEAERVTLYTPAYHLHSLRSGFAGVELDENAAGCVTGIRRIRNEALPPVLMTVVLAPGWDEAPLYQRLSWEREPREAQPRILVRPRDVSRIAIVRGLHDPLDSDLETLADSAVSQNGGFASSGRAAGPYTHIATFRPRTVRAGAMAVAQGELRRGGLTIGLVRNGQWTLAANVLEPGRFSVLLEAPADGDYTLVVANCLFGGRLANDYVVDRVGWVSGY